MELTEDHYTITNEAPETVLQKNKRTRRPWVYKTDYDFLNTKYRIVKALAIAGWIVFLITLKIALA